MNDNEIYILKTNLETAIDQEAPFTYEDTTTGDLLDLMSDALTAIEQLEAQRNTARRGEGC